MAESKKRKYKTSGTEMSPVRDSPTTSSTTVENRPSTKKKRSFSSIEKVQILKHLDTESLDSVCTKFDLHQSVLRKWRRKKAELQEMCEKENLKNVKNIKKPANVDVDHALYTWFLQARTSGIPITVTLLQSKAVALNEELGRSPNFKASNGWFWRWKQRKGIHRLAIAGEKLSANTEAAVQFKVEFENIIKNEKLTRAQIFNFDETGLWYKTMPNKTMAAREETEAPGFKNAKDRVTIGACCNADGSFKLPLVVIGKSARPRAFKNITPRNLPVSYKHQKSAWMDSSIFTDSFTNEFVPEVQKILREKNLSSKALLIIDNCRAHPSIKVDDIMTIFLPPNVTLLIQPLDQGILEAMKRRYKIRLVSSILNEQEQHNTPVGVRLEKIIIKDVVEWINDSWRQINPTTVYKCWNKIWPTETRSIATQTEETEETILTLSSPLVGAESEHSLIHGPEISTENIVQMLKKVQGYEVIDDHIVQEWITRVEDWET